MRFFWSAHLQKLGPICRFGQSHQHSCALLGLLGRASGHCFPLVSVWSPIPSMHTWDIRSAHLQQWMIPWSVCAYKVGRAQGNVAEIVPADPRRKRGLPLCSAQTWNWIWTFRDPSKSRQTSPSSKDGLVLIWVSSFNQSCPCWASSYLCNRGLCGVLATFITSRIGYCNVVYIGNKFGQVIIAPFECITPQSPLMPFSPCG